MSLQLRVTWKNAGHPLLPEKGADIRVEADGAALSPSSVKPGLRVFDVPAGTSKVNLKAQFSASFGAVGAGTFRKPPMTETVLQAEQSYTVINNGTELDPDFVTAFLQHHPLIDTKTIANGNGAVLAQIHTDFVDIRPFWDAYTTASQGAEFDNEQYKKEHREGTDLIALGFTGGDPKIWLASTPITLAFPDRNDIPALVFFRPANDIYTRIDQPHEMFRLNRYLLEQIPGSQDPTASDQILQDFIALRAEFEKALVSTKRPVVLLQPWQSGTDFGLAASAQLPELVNAAIRLLWVLKIIAVDRVGVRLGRLGLSGYSAGGIALWQALGKNAKDVRELYVFDANQTAANGDKVVRWFRSHPDNRLRLSSGLNVAANRSIELAILKLDSSAANRVTVVPRSYSDYAPGVNPRWDHVTALQPQFRGDPWVWHQYAVFGSFPGSPTPPHVTFLEQFLNDSGF